jgi:uncharacterized protein
MTKTIALALVLGASLSSGARAESEPSKIHQPSITVTGTASRDVVPDMAILKFSIRAEKPTAPAATDDVAATSKAIVNDLLSQGIEKKNIKSLLDVSAVYDEDHGPDGRMTKRTLRGYQATVSVALRVNEIDRVHVLARQVIAKGANIFQGIDFSVSPEKSPGDELRGEATRSALRKAKLYTDAAGVHLGGILLIEPDPSSDGMADIPRPAMPRNQTVAKEIPIEPGMQTFETNVRITWEIVP